MNLRTMTMVGFLFLECSASGGAGAQELVVPVHCSDGEVATSCGVDESLTQAQQSYAAAPAGKLAAAVGADVCGGAEDPDLYVWAPPSRVTDGEKIVTSLTQLLASGRPTAGGAIIALGEGDDAAEQHIALCRATVIGQTFGPPEACHTVAIITSKETYLRSTASKSSDCPLSLDLAIDHSIEVTFDIKTTKPVDPFAAALSSMLTNDFVLQFERRPPLGTPASSIVFEAAAPLRDSKILADGYRESLSVDLYLGMERSDQLVVDARIKPMVTKEAAGDITKYHGPNQGQTTAYGNYADEHIKAAILAVCPGAIVGDDDNIDCSK